MIIQFEPPRWLLNRGAKWMFLGIWKNYEIFNLMIRLIRWSVAMSARMAEELSSLYYMEKDNR